MSTTVPKWAVLTWEEPGGQVYCCDVTPMQFWGVSTDFDRPDGNELSDVITPRTKPVFNCHGQGEMKECRKFPPGNFQQAIDTTQRMVREHRP